jgi:amino acid transporter
MTEHPKLSLSTVIFININIMIGTGLFINTTQLAQKVGILGGFSYALVGLLMLPLILSIAHLLTIYPSGGFYIFGAQGINPFAGFISTWSYFFGKLGSATIGIHTFVSIIQQLIPSLSALPLFTGDTVVLLFFVGLNFLNIQTGSSIQRYLLFAKLTPIIFLFLSALFLFNGNNVTFLATDLQAIPFTIPLVLFSLLGFEAACSLSRNLHNAHINAARAVLISYAIVLAISILYQFAFYGILGDLFLQFNDYRDAFPALMRIIFNNHSVQHCGITLIHLAIGSSALSGAYGILFSNQWNLHILAEKKHIFGASFFSKLNNQLVPFGCMIAQGCICFFYLFLTHGHLFILQQLAALGAIFTYSISLYALITTLKRRKSLTITPLLGLASCALLLSLVLYNLSLTGPVTLFTFLGILIAGSFTFYMHSPKESR